MEKPVLNKRFAAVANLFFSCGALAVSIVTGLILVPVYLRYMNPGTYGVWLASGGILSMLGICESGISMVLTQKLAAAWGAGENERFAVLAATGLSCSIAVGFAVMFFGAIFAWLIPSIFGVPVEGHNDIRWAVLFAAVGTALMIMAYSLGAVPQALQETVAPGIVLIIALCGNVIGILIGLYSGWGVIALGFGMLCLGVCQFMGLLIVCCRHWRRLALPGLATNRSEVRQFVNETKALFVAKLSSALGNNLQAPVAAFAISSEATTILMLTGRMISLVPMLVLRVGTATFAGMAHLMNSSEDERARVVTEIVTVSTVVSGLGLGGVICFNEAVVTLWVGEEMFGGEYLNICLALAAFMAVRQALLSNLAISLGQIRAASRWMIIEVVARLLLLLLLVPIIKIYGIPLGGVAASLIAAVGFSILLNSHCGLMAGTIWLSGWRGFFGAVLVAILWRSLAPPVLVWPQFLAQGVICLGLMIATTLALDRGWRQSVGKTLNGIRGRA